MLIFQLGSYSYLKKNASTGLPAADLAPHTAHVAFNTNKPLRGGGVVPVGPVCEIFLTKHHASRLLDVTNLCTLPDQKSHRLLSLTKARPLWSLSSDLVLDLEVLFSSPKFDGILETKIESSKHHDCTAAEVSSAHHRPRKLS